mmetsp:Transcript_40340/g.160251  ORF Transcript_40340/g.160251 Transcript_40340/m.160251 type:complete len:153 (-) Transcript_40340:1403-1861(-)
MIAVTPKTNPRPTSKETRTREATDAAGDKERPTRTIQSFELVQDFKDPNGLLLFQLNVILSKVTGVLSDPIRPSSSASAARRQPDQVNPYNSIITDEDTTLSLLRRTSVPNLDPASLDRHGFNTRAVASNTYGSSERPVYLASGSLPRDQPY